MSESPSQTSPPPPAPKPIVRGLELIGEATIRQAGVVSRFLEFLGGATYLIGDTLAWTYRTLVRRKSRFGREHLWAQMVRVGVRSIPIVSLVQVFIGIILALQMAPTLRNYGQIQRVADIVAIAMFRELGPLLSGIVLSGFAGASIAAELGTMVEGEEIKALRACALNPVRFLVMPRFLATVIMLTMLTVIADVVGVLGGLVTSTLVLNIAPESYMSYTRAALTNRDFITGLVKAGVFGVMISMIACYEGLNVTGGAEGVGRATTSTVVKSIVALITADVVFTAVFYAFKL
ncbi:MAG TPA: ABC transporter permease [Phycisphaerae bacterium]|nr:ABC transporter permease [Phycisphaerae bacterium]